MKQLLFIFLLTVCTACGSATPQDKSQSTAAVPTDSVQARGSQAVSKEAEHSEFEEEKQATSDSIPAGARALIEAYPAKIRGYENNKIVFTDGATLTYDDGVKKGFTQMLDNSDIEDMFFTPYRVPKDKPEYLEDAGRSRCDALFKKMYGASNGQVHAQLVKVKWFGQTVDFSSTNGAAKQLEKVAAEIAQHPELKKYMKSSGTFYWRKVRGAQRMSAHSYGIAFDIAVSFSDYWLWKNPGAKETDKLKYANKIPRAIVDIFQKHGFIWGGSWYHYDTMHFEYRPELLLYAEKYAK